MRVKKSKCFFTYIHLRLFSFSPLDIIYLDNYVSKQSSEQRLQRKLWYYKFKKKEVVVQISWLNKCTLYFRFKIQEQTIPWEHSTFTYNIYLSSIKLTNSKIE